MSAGLESHDSQDPAAPAIPPVSLTANNVYTLRNGRVRSEPPRDDAGAPASQ